ncbi:hypothetical protein ACLB2K_040405 [Fragaria x ananassa]
MVRSLLSDRFSSRPSSAVKPPETVTLVPKASPLSLLHCWIGGASSGATVRDKSSSKTPPVRIRCRSNFSFLRPPFEDKSPRERRHCCWCLSGFASALATAYGLAGVRLVQPDEWLASLVCKDRWLGSAGVLLPLFRLEDVANSWWRVRMGVEMGLCQDGAVLSAQSLMGRIWLLVEVNRRLLVRENSIEEFDPPICSDWSGSQLRKFEKVSSTVDLRLDRWESRWWWWGEGGGGCRKLSHAQVKLCGFLFEFRWVRRRKEETGEEKRGEERRGEEETGEERRGEARRGPFFFAVVA